MYNAVAELFESAKVAQVTEEDRFLFDLQGFIHLKGVMSKEECKVLLETVKQLENQEYQEEERLARRYKGNAPQGTRQEKQTGQVRLNGLLRLNPIFDCIIDHPGVLPYLEEFIDGPQLINTWSISKTKGEAGGEWHRGRTPDHYSYRNGKISTRMINTVWFLTDNGPNDGCMVALPGGHKSNIDLKWKDYPGLAMPGAQRIVGETGDVFLFSETVLHTGIAKTTGGKRTNLYYNWISKDTNDITYSPEHNYHFCMPESIRQRFTPRRRKLTEWMSFLKSQESVGE